MTPFDRLSVNAPDNLHSRIYEEKPHNDPDHIQSQKALPIFVKPKHVESKQHDQNEARQKKRKFDQQQRQKKRRKSTGPKGHRAASISSRIRRTAGSSPQKIASPIR